jgi:hypothetical protein
MIEWSAEAWARAGLNPPIQSQALGVTSGEIPKRETARAASLALFYF